METWGRQSQALAMSFVGWQSRIMFSSMVRSLSAVREKGLSFASSEDSMGCGYLISVLFIKPYT